MDRLSTWTLRLLMMAALGFAGACAHTHATPPCQHCAAKHQRHAKHGHDKRGAKHSKHHGKSCQRGYAGYHSEISAEHPHGHHANRLFHEGMHGAHAVRSTRGFAETVSALNGAIAAQGLKVMATIDHAANAQAAGLSLRPTTIILFGNPKLGTALMSANKTVALSLPMKMLVYQEGEQVFVVYESAQHLAHRHGLIQVEDALAKIQETMDGLANTAANPKPTE